MKFKEYIQLKKPYKLSYSLMSTATSVELLYSYEFSVKKYSSKPGQDLKSVGDDIWKALNLHEKAEKQAAIAEN